MKAKKCLSKSKRVVISAVAAICALSSVAAISASAATSVTVTSSQTTNGYILKLSACTGSSLGSRWEVANGGPVTLKSKNSVMYVKTNGTTAVYNGNNSYASIESTVQVRTVSTSSLSNYSRVAKIEATGHSVYINTNYYPNREVSINAYY